MKPAKLTTELKRFEDLAVIKYDAAKPLEVRAKASAELSRWTEGKPPEIVRGALVDIWRDEAKPIEVRAAAYGALLDLLMLDEKVPKARECGSASSLGVYAMILRMLFVQGAVNGWIARCTVATT